MHSVFRKENEAMVMRAQRQSCLGALTMYEFIGSICFASSVSAFAQSKKNPEDAVQFTIWVSSLFFFSFLFFGRYELREGVEMRKVRNTSWPLHDSYEFHRLLNAFGIVAAALE
eukprot:TRINITY_DN42_c0_g1_i9.p2 TRINITY_DN42_c0_g1~~TRINITY_DN42_c0_g1_i9.p2  ORF type:complete len:114 (-),score=8.77 TRINITY_DN42_c0_g1_i9:124-465(-)